MVNVEVIRRRLNKLDEYLAVLRGIQKYQLQEFLTNPEHYGSAERFLQLAIETTMDIGNHIIADENLGQINWYSDIPTILCERKYISDELHEKWIRMIGFRNILVHDYLEINREIVYRVMQDNLQDLEELKRVFATFL